MVQCASCGHQSSKDMYCEMCGAALPQSAPAAEEEDDVLSLMMGLVCPSCDSYNDPGTTTCIVCGAAVGDGADGEPTTQQTPQPAAPAQPSAPAAGGDAPSWMAAPEGKPLATANAMPAVDLNTLEGQQGLAAPSSSTAQPQATPAPAPAPETFPCEKCGKELSNADKFCANCGTKVGGDAPAPAPASAPPSSTATMVMAAAQPKPAPQPDNAPAATMMMPSLNVNAGMPGAAPGGGGQAPSATMFFGAAQVERFARLILVKGHTQFGTQWRLQAGETIIGRNQGVVIFPDDEFLADRHCKLEFRGDDLWLVPEKTTNGVYLQLKGKAPLSPGSEFIAGNSRFRILPDQERAVVLQGRADDAKLYGSMAQDLNILLQRVAVDPRLTETYIRPQRLLSVGRSNCDLNFPTDGYLSTRHVQLIREDTGYMLEDLGSRNGTFIRCDHEVKLQHGDGLLLGEQVMRVEVIAGLPQPG